MQHNKLIQYNVIQGTIHLSSCCVSLYTINMKVQLLRYLRTLKYFTTFQKQPDKTSIRKHIKNAAYLLIKHHTYLTHNIFYQIPAHSICLITNQIHDIPVSHCNTVVCCLVTATKFLIVPAKLKVVRGFERWLVVQTLRMCQSMSQIREVNDYKDESEGFLEPFGLLGQESTLRAFCTMMTEGFRLSLHFCHVSKSEGVCLLLNVCVQ